MARKDYEHWNEEADRVWYEEEGRHPIDGPIYSSDEDIKQSVYDEEDYE